MAPHLTLVPHWVDTAALDHFGGDFVTGQFQNEIRVLISDQLCPHSTPFRVGLWSVGGACRTQLGNLPGATRLLLERQKLITLVRMSVRASAKRLAHFDLSLGIKAVCGDAHVFVLFELRTQRRNDEATLLKASL